jgi:hypothetical protein
VANTDYQLQLVMKGASISVLVNGSFIRSWGYNSAVVDGSFGLFARGATASFDNFRIRTNDRAFTAPSGALTVDGGAADANGAPPLGEAALVPVVADAERAWIASGADPSAFDGVRVATADLSDGQLGQTIGKTIYIDVDAAGFGWGAGGADLLEAIEHELGHVLGFQHEDANDHAVMRAILPVAGLSAALPTTILEATLTPARAAADVTVRTQVEATRVTQAAPRTRVETAGARMPYAIEIERARFERAAPAAARLVLKLRGLLTPIALTASRAGASVYAFDTFFSE